jgi:hypothetical protein
MQIRLARFFLIVTVAAMLPLVPAMVAQAEHRFSDVPATAIFHDAVDWLANRLITLGCTASLYCPNDFVTRAQMALFMQRLGSALTPRYLQQSETGASADLDAAPVVCATTIDYSATFSQTAVFIARIDGTGSGPGTYRAKGVISTDSGATWNDPAGAAFNFAHIDASARGFNAFFGTADLTQGMAYRFGMRVDRAPATSGTGDLSDYHCVLSMQIVNRNPGSAPFGSPNRSRTPARR